jgi:peptide chain release factor 1
VSSGSGSGTGERRPRKGLSLEARLEAALARAAEIETALADPAVASDPKQLKTLGRELSRLTLIRQTANRLDKLTDELDQSREMSRDADAEFAALAKADMEHLAPEIEGLRQELQGLLVPPDPLDDRDTILEIRAGTGGDEAALFAADLLRMYQRYAERRHWTVETVSLSEGNLGGVKDAVFKVRGESVYGRLRHESGVHRVQRVPATEAQGRIHTSAATVAVLPEAEDVDVSIEEADLKIDVFRSSGPGGQSVNTTDSAVRITHVPTGVVVQCQDQKSQLQNKAKAMEVLRARLLDRKVAEQQGERARERKAMVGTGDRSAKIRTYNFPQNRVTDHRINFSTHRLDGVLDGEIDELIDRLRSAYREELDGN